MNGDMLELAGIFGALALVLFIGMSMGNASEPVGAPRAEWGPASCVIDGVQYAPSCKVKKGCGCDMTWGVPLTEE